MEQKHPRFPLPLPNHHTRASNSQLHGFHLQDLCKSSLSRSTIPYLACLASHLLSKCLRVEGSKENVLPPNSTLLGCTNPRFWILARRLLRHPPPKLLRRLRNPVSPQVPPRKDLPDLPEAEIHLDRRHLQLRRDDGLSCHGNRIPGTGAMHLPPQHLRYGFRRQVPLRYFWISEFEPEHVYVLPGAG